MTNFLMKNLLSTFTYATVLLGVATLTIDWTSPVTTEFSNSTEVLSQYCAHDALLQQKLEDPVYQSKYADYEKDLYNHLNGNGSNEEFVADYTLPVVVHIVHQNGVENISDAQIFQAMQDLNDAFENVGYYDQGTGVNTQIEFCLATQDPDGNPTDGITRDDSPLTDMVLETEDIALKDLNRWDPLRYINIWVVKEINSASFGSGVAGYAYFPTSHGQPEDGLVVEAQRFGDTQSNSAVHVHEMGHYLGLYHTFQGGCPNDDCLADGDRVCDTPPDQTTAAAPCGFPQNSCSTDVNTSDPNNPLTSDEDDMIENYMDYGDLLCYSAFTAGQTERMVFSIQNIRQSLLGSIGCQDPCTTNITAGFSPDALSVDIGGTVTFTNSSQNATTYDWKNDGVSFSNNTNASFQFNTLGSFEITLVATNADPNCVDSVSIIIEVTCPVDASFIQDGYILNVGETVSCTNTSINATTYEWYVDGILTSTSTDFSTSFPTGGLYSIYLIAYGPLCSDTTLLTNFVQVGDCDITIDYSPTNPNTCDDIQFTANTSCDYDTWLWQFCEIENLGLPNVGTPNSVGSSPAHTDFIFDEVNGTGYHLFVTRYNQATNRVVRLDYGFDLNSVPTSTTLTNFPTIPTDANHIKNEGIDIVFENGNYHGFFATWDHIYRFDFGSDITNENPVVTLVQDFSDASWIHSLDMYKVGANWWGIASARSTGNVVVFYLGNNITGDILSYNTYDGGNANAAFTGATYLVDDDNHYILATDFQNGLIRFDFGSSLANVPTATNLGIFGTGNQWSVQAYKECDDTYAVYLFKETGDDHKILTFSPTVSGAPTSVTDLNGLGRVSGVSSFHRIGSELFFYIVKSTDGEVNRLSFENCSVSTPSSSNQQIPSLVYYSDPGTYDVSLIVNEGLPTQQIICSQITIDTCDQENCFNGRDDDGDGLIDCYDPDCCGDDTCDDFYYADCPIDCEYTGGISDFELELEWTTQNSGQSWCGYNTPITGDVDGDGVPEILGKPCTSGSGSPWPNILVIDGTSGTIENVITTPAFRYINSGPSIADLDGNGMVEIFFQASDNFANQNYTGGVIISGDVRRRIICYEFDGTTYVEKWISNVVAGYDFIEDANTVSAADFDGDGMGEIYVGNQIFNGSDGTLIAEGGVNNRRGIQDQNGIGEMHNRAVAYSVAVDVLPDNFCANCKGLEIVAGTAVYSVNIDPAIPSNSSIDIEVEMPGGEDGRTSIADIDNDGDLDAIVTSNDAGNASIAGIQIWDIQTPTYLVNVNNISTGDGEISQANIADFDGDGQVEFAVCNKSLYTVYEWNGINGLNTLWSIVTNDGSGQTGSTVFDFNNDGQFEVVYRDQTTLRILDGATGAELASEFCSSLTRVEYPVVVDVDADGETELLCSCVGELRAYGSLNAPWVSTRSVWNQHNYFNVNINDDLSIPINQQSHHIVGDSIVLNNFLTQYANPQFPIPDATVSVDSFGCGLDSFYVQLTVCNIGDLRLTNETPITFYDSDPTSTNATPLTTLELGQNIDPDTCVTLGFFISPQYNQTIYVVINDDASLAGPYDLATDFPVTSIAECDYTNNIDSFIQIGNPPMELDLGPDVTICDNGVIELNAGSGFVSYEWQDGWTDSTYTAFGAGKYWVDVLDSCGNIQSDTIEVIELEPTIATVEPQIATFCPPTCVTFTVQGNFFDHYEWQPSDYLDCDTCKTVTACPPGDFQYILIAWTDDGCYSLDTVLTQTTSYQTQEDFTVCVGGSIVIDGQVVSTPGTYTQDLTASNGCDSMHTITLQNFPETNFGFSISPACPGADNGSATVNINSGQTPFSYNWDVAGVGDTPTINNQPGGNYNVTITDGNNCTIVGTAVIPEDNNFDVIADVLDETCFEIGDGRIEIANPIGAEWTYSLDDVNFQSSPIFENISPGNYTIYLTDGFCEYETQVSITAANAFNIGIDASPSTIVEVGGSVDLQITNLPSNVDSIEWENTETLSCDDCPNPTATPTEDGTTYSVTVTDLNGCISTALVVLTFPCQADKIIIPNVFTPDGDGLNDTFGAVIGEGVEMVSSMKIFDRWGEKVFESTGNNAVWDGLVDGKAGVSDVYVYVIRVVCPEGEEQYVGDVTLLR